MLTVLVREHAYCQQHEAGIHHHLPHPHERCEYLCFVAVPTGLGCKRSKAIGLEPKGPELRIDACNPWHQTSCCKVLSRACRPLIKKEEKTYQFPSQQPKGSSPASLSRHRLPLDLIELHVTEISSPGDTLVVFVGGALDRDLQPPPACRFLKFGNGASATGPNSSSSSDSFPKKHTWVQKV